MSDSASDVSASSISAAMLNPLIGICDLLVAAQGPALQLCHLDGTNYLKQDMFYDIFYDRLTGLYYHACTLF